MGFLTEYKRLDNLCKDLLGSDIGITSYIEEMKNLNHHGFRPNNWNEDYKYLRYYRHIRNQIVHENNVDEDNMCSYDDVDWIIDFHNRILNTQDPIAQYYANQEANKSGYQFTENVANNEYGVNGQNKSRKIGIYIALFILIFAIVFGIGLVIWQYFL